MTSTSKTFLLLATLTALFMAVGFVIGGKGGMVVAFLFALVGNGFAYWNSADMVLSLYGAREVDAVDAPEFHGLVLRLAKRAGLPMPRVFIIESDQPNAFATGRDPAHAAVAATTGLLSMLSHEEVAGVIGHELGHVRNHDILIMTVTATLAGAISMIANIGLLFGSGRDVNGNETGPSLIGGLLLMIVAPLAAMLVQTAISRAREYDADRAGAEICGHPRWLASALERIHVGTATIANPAADANPATAHLFIINPLHASALATLFSTHPATEERVRRLLAMSAAPPRAGRAKPSGPWG